MASTPSDPARSDPTEALIGGQYAVSLAHPLPGTGGGLASFAVVGHPGLMAVQALRQSPARWRPLQTLSFPLENVLGPVAHGVAPALPEPGFPPGRPTTGYFVISRAPQGASVAADLHPWREAELLDLLLRPIARGLEQLHSVGITHRAIRPDNVFQSAGQPAILGAAWSAPPAALQPSIFEPPYAAICLPTGRGEGMPADDIYALGVLLLTLALGRVPLANLDDAAVLHRKLEFGSYAALVGQERLSPAIAELIRGMLAEDPDHRPSAALLLDPPAARARRVAARPSRRAQRPLEIGGTEIWSAREAAHALAADPLHGIPALRTGRVDHWLRHSLGDAGLASRLDEVVRYRVESRLTDPSADAMLSVRCVALLDPLAPLCWDGFAIWPDGIGPALAEASAAGDPIASSLADLIRVEAIGAWAQLRPDRCDVATLRTDARQMQAVQGMVGQGGGMRRLCYQLNPLLPCASPLLAARFVARLGDLLPALDAGAEGVDQTRPMDAEIAAFVAARSERRLEGEVAALTESDTTLPGALAQLRLYAQLQNLVSSRPVPALAAWLAERSGALAGMWFNRARRDGFQELLSKLAADGQIGAMLSLVEDRTARDLDREQALRAVELLTEIDTELNRLHGGKADRADLAFRLGQEIAAGLGLAALAGVLTTAALG
jgi:hypothetical protein